jgi:putative intracellular protease/amidase
VLVVVCASLACAGAAGGGFAAAALADAGAAPGDDAGAPAPDPDTTLAIPRDVKALVLLDHQFGANLNTPVVEGSVNILEQLAGFGWEITLTGLQETLDSCSASGEAFGSRRVRVDRLVADIDDIGAYDCLILPPGREHAGLLASVEALGLVRSAMDDGLVVAAWCRAVRVLAAADVLRGRRITGHPDYAEEYKAAGAVYLGSGIPPVTDGNLVTTTRSRFYRTAMCEAIGRAVAANRLRK